MKNISIENIKFMEYLMAEYNDYSELVALNYQKKADEGTKQWNRGHLFCIEEIMDRFAKEHKVNLTFTCKTHPFLDRELEYRTVHLLGEDTTYHRTRTSSFQVR